MVGRTFECSAVSSRRSGCLGSGVSSARWVVVEGAVNGCSVK